MKQFLETLFVSVIILNAFSSFAQLTLQDSLLAHYKLDNNGLDATGNGNDGAVFGAQSVDDRFGNPNSAYQFDGVNDRVEISNAFYNKRPGTDEFTMSAWIKPTGQKTGIILSQTTSCSSVSEDYFILALTYVNGLSDVYAQFYNHNPFVDFDDQLVFDNNWHFIVYTYKSGEAKLYLDGILKSSDSYTHSPQNFTYNSAVDWVIGGAHLNNCSHGNYFEGLIDDVKIYSRALDDTEVVELSKTGAVSFSKQTTNCDLDVEFLANAPNADSYSWNFGDGNSSTQENPTHTYDTEGTYTVILSVIQNGIEATYSENVEVNEAPVADFSMINVVQTNSLVVFAESSSADVVSWDWDFGNGTSSTSQYSSTTYSVSGLYTVELTVTDNFGCQDVKTKEITASEEAKDFFINLPNAFTPNGDARNDRFEILSASDFYEIKDFEIYNRWGNLVYDSPDKIGWDGNYNGVLAPAATYIYVLNIRLQDGTIRQFKGELLLIR
ncbi:MAG: PKD domain-containing protein [Saprospiraceae bacterium]